MVIISTIITIPSDKKGKFSVSMQLLSCFSARKSFNEIFRINYGHRGFDSIHFLRVLLMVLVVIGHRHMQYMYAGTMNIAYLEWVSIQSNKGFIIKKIQLK